MAGPFRGWIYLTPLFIAYFQFLQSINKDYRLMSQSTDQLVSYRKNSTFILEGI